MGAKVHMFRAWLNLLVRLAHEARPVFDGAEQVAAEDEVELVAVQPVVLDVVDLEAHVRRDTRLKWRDFEVSKVE